MLTNQELNYMTKKEIPYPGVAYSLNALKEVKMAIKEYQQNYENHIFDIEFSNGENIIFQIDRRNLAHMLGLNFKTLTDEEEKELIFEQLVGADGLQHITSFDILTAISENPRMCVELNELYDRRLFNFYRLKARSEIFQRFSSFYSFNFGCIKFSAEIAQNNGYQTRMNSNHFLYIDSNDIKVPYYMMGLNSKDDETYIETLFANKEVEKMFKGQTIAYPINITINNNENLVQKEASYLEKLSMLKTFKITEEKTGAKLDAYYDQLISYSKAAIIEEKKQLLKSDSRK